jgi:hypothetical protein
VRNFPAGEIIVIAIVIIAIVVVAQLWNRRR